METKITVGQLLRILLYILSWIIFVGVSINAGGFISNTFYTMSINPEHAQNFWPGLNLSALYKYDPGYFLLETLLMSMVAILKATIFYLIIDMLHNKKLSLSQPFNTKVRRFILRVAYLSLLTGLFSAWGTRYADWFVKQGVQIPAIQQLNLDGADVWLFMSVTLFVIAQVFKRGIEIQAENELTV